MKILELFELKKTEPAKPRNFVAKNAKMGGAGAHKDKKKAAKQGDVKHKNKMEGFNAADIKKKLDTPTKTEIIIVAGLLRYFPETRPFAPLLTSLIEKHPELLNGSGLRLLRLIPGLDNAVEKVLSWAEDNPDHPAVMKLKNELEKKTIHHD